eukprot:7363549-Alexandrium_andersonii.AAC.1
MESGFAEALIPGDEYTVQAAMKRAAQDGLSTLPETLEEAGDVHERARAVASWRRRAAREFGAAADGRLAPVRQ